MKQRILSILVDNTAGVLTRLAGLFSRRGYNIDSITAGVTANPRFTRITIVTSGDELVLEQITNQVKKQVDVRDVKVLEENSSVIRELILLKIKVDANQRDNVLAITNIFRAKIVDVGCDSMIIELTGTQSKLDAFLELLNQYEVLELARTGITALSRGMEDVRYFE
jgi:acetolactate synthase-1/3 small subunit|uniref:Acetolactate synthase small subunit n=1 Tax=Eubacterium cellulosolvens (strain ATCC 43171 / JCM 9499 / 6) TaxID=633697 RepID=I5AQZ6_EUBC6|nr:acetolactate synthase small subunit [[Eubacterium] cellulosolvens]